MMNILLYVLIIILSFMHGARGDEKLPLNGLTNNYYKNKTTCINAENIIMQEVNKAWKADPTITAALLRLIYSDCFITGCDASILLDGDTSEKTAPQNSGLRGFDVIDKIKLKLESSQGCKGIVSCTDIMHLATRDAVALASGGQRYLVFTGRRDGNSSDAKQVDLPSPYVSWDDALTYFESRSLNELDLGTLLGAHTIGVTHCSYIHDRIYNYNDTGMPDDTMNCNLARKLSKKCPYKPIAGQLDPTVYLNAQSGSKYNFNNTYYSQILSNKAVLKIDQEFMTRSDGVRIAAQFALDFNDFYSYFSFSINRMGSIGVITGSNGQIRQNCRVVNPKK